MLPIIRTNSSSPLEFMGARSFRDCFDGMLSPAEQQNKSLNRLLCVNQKTSRYVL